MAPRIIIDRSPTEPGVILVIMPGGEGEEASPHRNYFSALAEGLRLQRQYAPAVLSDRIGGGE